MNSLKVVFLSFALLFAFGITVQGIETVDTQEEPGGKIIIIPKAIDISEMIALDENVQPGDLEVAEPTLLPDHPFYFLKNWGRGIRAFFTFDRIKKIELREKFANEKLMELKKMVEEKKNAKAIEKAIENYQEEVEKIKETCERIKEKAKENPRVESFLDKFTGHQILHQRILQKLETQVPSEVLEKIKEARERHLERFAEVMTKLEDRKEKIRERLEQKLEEIKGSEFKDFKNLEVLKELEEKVPEEAKEAIRKARENTLQRLETKIGQLSEETLERFKAYTETISGTKEIQIEILENLELRLEEKPEIQQKIMEAKEKILEKSY